MFSAALLLAVTLWTAPQSVKAPAQNAPRTAVQEGPLLPETDRWLSEGEHQEIPWKVRIEKPVTTFQLRQMVKVTAKIDSATLQSKSAHRNLFFVIKVADAAHHWLPGENSVTQEFDKGLDRSSDVQLQSEVLLRPGKYTIATFMYDSVLGEHNVSLLPVDVPSPKNDPLPHAVDLAPVAEFVHGGIQGEDTFSDATADLPLSVRRPVQLELLVDLSTREHQVRAITTRSYSRSTRDLPPPPGYKHLHDKSYFIGLLQSASVIASLDAKPGCMKVSVFDAIREKELIGPTAPDKVHWRELAETAAGPNKDTISVSALAGRSEVGRFVLREFDGLAKAPTCIEADKKPLRIMIVLSHGLELPDGSQKTRLEYCDCKVFYLRQTDTAMNFDDLKSMLLPLSPQELEFNTPEQFRRRLAQLMEEIKKLAQ